MLLSECGRRFAPATKAFGYQVSGDGWGNALLGNMYGGSRGVADMHLLAYNDHDDPFWTWHVDLPLRTTTCADFPTAVYLTRVHPLLELPCF